MLFHKPIAVLLATLLLAVSGCGFQLRDTGMSSVQSLRLVSSAGLGSTRSTIEERLSIAGVSVGESGPVVTLLDERSSRRPVSTSSAVDAAQYEIRLEVDVQIERDGDQGSPTTLLAERIYSVDAVNLMGSYEEQSLLMTEMREDIARQLMRLLEATL